jgi:mannose-6-phosphate isomerase-like protein (cupin superfamily)
MRFASSFSCAAFFLLLVSPLTGLCGETPVLVSAKEMKWTDAAEPAGARLAVLWGDAQSSDHGTLVRWKFNSKLPDLVRTQDVHVVVLAGTFTVEIDGGYREFGPGGFVSIPKGVRHTLGCEAAGECRFVMHHPGPVQVTKGK